MRMKYVYIDGSAGVSGDMLLGALLDCGIEPSAFQKTVIFLLNVMTGTIIKYNLL